MKKTLRKKFIFFAMSAVTSLLIVLVGAINIFSWIILDQQSDNILHTIAQGNDSFMQADFFDPAPFQPPMNMDTIKSARFFMVCIDANGKVKDTNLDQISSVTIEQACQYAKKVSDSNGKIDTFKYESKLFGTDRLIFFMDISGQLQTFLMVFSISGMIALICWLFILIFVILLSSRVVRPILAGMEKQKQFITNAGHELKTPLAIIQSNNDASSLIYGETKYSQNIRQQTQRLNALMTNLLTLAKLDEEIKLPTEAVRISELVQKMLPGYEGMFAQKNIDFSADIQPELLMQVHNDSFLQMMSVLLDNAAKYTPNGGRIRLTICQTGGHTEIIEENTCDAPGSYDTELLFERFYRGDSARTQNDMQSSGYGIGLSAARAIAENFGGTLKAKYTSSGTIQFIARF